jgi:chromosome segregation ATPase
MNSANMFGAAVTLLSSAFVGALFSRKTEPPNDRVRELERELELAKGELYVQHEALDLLKSQNEKFTEQIKTRDAKIAELENALESAGNEKFAAESGLNASNSRTEALKSELESLRAKLVAAEVEAQSLSSKLTEAEAEVKTLNERPAPPNPAMVAEIESLRKTVLSQNSDVAKLLERVKELAPLKLQITDRDLRLREMEAKLAEAEKAKEEALAKVAGSVESKNDEIAALKDKVVELEHAANAKTQRISELSELAAHHDFMHGEKDSLIAELQSQVGQVETAETDQSSVLRDKDAAISLLQLRIKELEPLTAQLAERDLKLRRLEEKLAEKPEASQQVTAAETDGEKDDEIARLQTRLLELETELKAAQESALTTIPPAAIAAEAKAQELQAEQVEEIGHRDEEIARLQVRIAELEPLHAQLFARDARLIELEARLQSAINDKEAETKHFESLMAELEPAGARAEAAEARLAKLEEQHQATVNNLEVEISGLRVKLAGLEGASAMLEDCLAKLRAVEAKAEDR